MSEFDKIHTKLDQIEDKLDRHLERLSRAETDISWVKGYFKIGFSSLLTILIGLLLYILTGQRE